MSRRFGLNVFFFDNFHDRQKVQPVHTPYNYTTFSCTQQQRRRRRQQPQSTQDKITNKLFGYQFKYAK